MIDSIAAAAATIVDAVGGGDGDGGGISGHGSWRWLDKKNEWRRICLPAISDPRLVGGPAAGRNLKLKSTARNNGGNLSQIKFLGGKVFQIKFDRRHVSRREISVSSKPPPAPPGGRPPSLLLPFHHINQ